MKTNESVIKELEELGFVKFLPSPSLHGTTLFVYDIGTSSVHFVISINNISKWQFKFDNGIFYHRKTAITWVWDVWDEIQSDLDIASMIALYN